MHRPFVFAVLLLLPACGTRPVPVLPPEDGKPRLAVLVFFDQMRGDYLERWGGLFAEGGFRRLTGEGASFTDCHYPQAGTWTAAGHAGVAAGCPPAVHGIIANEWHDPFTGKAVLAAGDRERAGPHLLLAPTFGDALKKATAGKGKVVSLSLKGRSAILPAGNSPDAVYWLDGAGFVTSPFYRDGPHAWMRRFNNSGPATGWRGKEWARLRADVDYDKHSGPDDAEGEGVRGLLGRTFPHRFDGGGRGTEAAYLEQLAVSPMGNELLLAAVKEAVVAEGLGLRDAPDFLNISFSSNDLVGHAFGPDSHEVLDTTLRSDLIVRDLLAFLDEKVGEGNYALVLTSDHGICPLPEASRARKLGGGRILPGRLVEAAEDHLDAKWPGEGGRWIEGSVSNMLYLNRGALKARGVALDDASAELAKWLPTYPGIQAACTGKQLRGETAASDAVGRMMQASFHPGRSGDVSFVTSPHHFVSSRLTGTTHGSPHPYDTHVPLVVFGPGVKPGTRKGRVSPEAAAAILATALGIAPPAKATVKAPAGLFEE